MWLWVFTKTRKLRPLLKCKLNHFLRNEKCWIKSQLGHLQNKSKNLQKNEKGFFDNTMVLDCNSAALFLKQILERVTEEDLILFLSLQQWSQHFLPLKKGFRLILELTQKISLFVMFCFHSAANNFSTFFTSIVIWSGLLAGWLASKQELPTYRRPVEAMTRQKSWTLTKVDK